jgi:hypothetical protein
LLITASDLVINLVEHFGQHRDDYRSGIYNETQLRREFLEPFFEALGWDLFNKQNYAEIYKDVIHEDSLKIESEKKALDYTFRIGGPASSCTPRTPQDQEMVKREIASTDRQIDTLVYELYGLTEDEIKIVEGNG